MNNDKMVARYACFKYTDLDAIGVAETHLSPRDVVQMDRYTWIGHSRKTKHKKAVSSSGGVGLLIKSELMRKFEVVILDKSHEDILWVNLVCKEDESKCFPMCVCYLPPEGSSSNIDPNDFFNTLLHQVSRFQKLGTFQIIGDFNSRLGDMQDYIEGADSISERNVIDEKKNGSKGGMWHASP